MKTSLLAFLLSAITPAVAATCDSLNSLTLPDTTITLAQPVGPGEFNPPSGRASGPPNSGVFKNLPAFCRVAATLTPTSDSDIKIEVWLPASGWNGKFQAVGNGAFSGAIAYPAMKTALARGYATSWTDTDHVGHNASSAPRQPQRLIDFAWRAVHEMTAASKTIIASYYDACLKFSYWNGCS